MSLLKLILLVSELIMNYSSASFLLSVFEIELKDANFEIVNVVVICIEM